MPAILRVVDERFSATPTRMQALELRLASERVSAREILRRRVEAEVKALNDRKWTQLGQTRSLLVAPDAGSAEAILNAPRQPASGPQVDVEAEITRAINAFSAGRFLMLLDDRQLETLDQEVGLRPDSEVVFLYITPLKGG